LHFLSLLSIDSIQEVLNHGSLVALLIGTF
jgi:hypothetical protein